MKTLIKTLDATIVNDSIKSINELRVYVPLNRTVFQTGFTIKLLTAQTFKVIGGCFSDRNGNDLGTTKSIAANSNTLVVVKPSTEECYLIIPNRFQISELNLIAGIDNNHCSLNFTECTKDFIGIKFSLLRLNGYQTPIETKYLSATTDGIMLDTSTAITGDIAELPKIRQLTVYGSGIYGDISELSVADNFSLVDIVGSPNIEGELTGFADKIPTPKTYLRTARVRSNGVITYNGTVIGKYHEATISIPANSTEYTITIS